MLRMVRVTHYSDALCIWAYISQIRIEELQNNFGADVAIEYRFMPVFGDVAGKIAAQWAERGGIAAYASHVQEVAAKFSHISPHPRVWLDNTPASSLPAHLLLCAVRAGGDEQRLPRLLEALREAFFVECRDIARQDVLLDVATSVGINQNDIQDATESGVAHALLAADIAAANDSGIRSSPTLVLNEGRQTLAGNVGYRVIEANIRELLDTPDNQQSWC